MMDPDRRTAKSLLDHWQLIVMLTAGAVACVKFYYTVQDISVGQERWKTSSLNFRDKARDEFEEIRVRLTKLEQWKEDHNERMAH